MNRSSGMLRSLPSVDALLREEATSPLLARFGREAVVGATRRLLDEVREEILRSGQAPPPASELVRRLEAAMEQALAPSFLPVINATGVVIHTNLGRAPLPREALERIDRTGGRYLNLEFDLETGKRGRRGAGLEEHVRAVTGAEDALVVNNNAAAVLLLLSGLAQGREVVVSRGELVEIGGSFRIPDVMATSGARMIEVGTTNRTHLKDYENACGPDTALLLKVHPSNYKVVGFTREIGLKDLGALGRRLDIPVAMDLGSGLLERREGLDLPEEMTVQEALQAGADAVTFSGDKALGGPQAGYLVGKKEVVQACRRHPFQRAIRPGRLTLAAAEATWSLYRAGRTQDLPVIRMMSATREELASRVAVWMSRLVPLAPDIEVRSRHEESRVGGGTAPDLPLSTTVLAVRSPREEAGRLAEKLRRREPPVVGRVQDGWLLLDPRTVLEDEEEDLLCAVESLASE